MRCLNFSVGLARSLLGAVCALLAVLAQATPPVAQRIVTLAPNLTELVYAAGAGDKLVGVEAHSDYPVQARRLPSIGDAFQVDYERLLSLRPDLVLVWDTGTPEPVIERLRGLKLPVQRVSISRLEQVADALRDIGQWAGTSMTAEAAAERYLSDLRSLKSGRMRQPLVTVFYQISERPLYTVNGRHFISEVIELCGGRNIFADLPQLAPPVSLEAVLERDPQVIITADGAEGDPLSVWRKWPRLRAVERGTLYTVDADRLARSTIRVIGGVTQMCEILDQARLKAVER